ncbi:MAG: low temperature requirement protein A [Sulfurifustaceae bacterium]
MPPPDLQEPRAEAPASRVSTIELFFDLVFVFTVTQITHLVDHAHGAADFLRALLVLVLIWWMYAGYAWLTNGVGAGQRMRLVLIAGAAGFLVISQAIPGSFTSDTLTFGLAYLYIVLLHLAAFASQGGKDLAHGILRVAPYNVGAALLIIAAAFLDPTWKVVCFAAAALLFVVTTVLRLEERFSINAPHFVERHGAVIMIVLGESVVAIGSGAADRALDAETVAEIVLSLLLIATLWWSYFDRDDERAEHAMAATPAKARSRMAILYWYAHLVMICGVVLVAAGVKQAVAVGAAPVSAPAWMLAAGIAVYLLGDILFRWIIDARPFAIRALGAILAPGFAMLGVVSGAVIELGALSVLVAVVLLAERRLSIGSHVD